MYLIIFVVIAVTIILCLFVVVLLLNISIFSYEKGQEIVTLAGNCQVDTSVYPDITSLPCCVDIFGNLSQNKYIESRNIIVSPNPVPYFNFCSGYCSLGVDPNDNTKCLGNVGNTQFTDCLNELRPQNCTGGVNSIAYTGGIKYFASNIGDNLCQVKRECLSS